MKKSVHCQYLMLFKLDLKSGIEGEQSINLTGDVKEFNLNVTVKPQSVLLSPIVIGIVFAMAVVIVVLGFLLMRSKNTVKNISRA